MYFETLLSLMPSLKDFVDALRSHWFTAVVAFVGCAMIIAGDYFQVPYLNSSPGFLLTTAVVVGVFSFSILVANIVYLPIALWKVLKRRWEYKQFKEYLAQEIEAAPDKEKFVLAYLITSGRRAFNAEIHNKTLSPLVSKGLIVKRSGMHGTLEWPYMVRDEVWEYLLANKERFLIEIPDGTGDPFDWRNTYSALR